MLQEKERYLSPQDLLSIKNGIPSFDNVKNMSKYYTIYSDSTRILILASLSLSELCVNEICDVLETNQTTISHQLKLLRDANIVDYRRVGKMLYYRIVDPYVNETLSLGVNQNSFKKERYF